MIKTLAKTGCSWHVAHRVVPLSNSRFVSRVATSTLKAKCSHEKTCNIVSVTQNDNLQALLDDTRHQLRAMQAIVKCAEEIANLQLEAVTKAFYLMAFWNEKNQQWYFKFGHSSAAMERTNRHRRELSLQTVLVAAIPCLDSLEVEQKFKKVPIVARNVTAVRRADGSMNKEVFPVTCELTLVTAYHIASHLAHLQRHDMYRKVLSGKVTDHSANKHPPSLF